MCEGVGEAMWFAVIGRWQVGVGFTQAAADASKRLWLCEQENPSRPRLKISRHTRWVRRCELAGSVWVQDITRQRRCWSVHRLGSWRSIGSQGPGTGRCCCSPHGLAEEKAPAAVRVDGHRRLLAAPLDRHLELSHFY